MAVHFSTKHNGITTLPTVLMSVYQCFVIIQYNRHRCMCRRDFIPTCRERFMNVNVFIPCPMWTTIICRVIPFSNFPGVIYHFTSFLFNFTIANRVFTNDRWTTRRRDYFRGFSNLVLISRKRDFTIKSMPVYPNSNGTINYFRRTSCLCSVINDVFATSPTTLRSCRGVRSPRSYNAYNGNYFAYESIMDRSNYLVNAFVRVASGLLLLIIRNDFRNGQQVNIIIIRNEFTRYQFVFRTITRCRYQRRNDNCVWCRL